MDLTDYVRVLRRRWPIIAVTTLAGLLIGFLTVANDLQQGEQTVHSATATLVVTGMPGSDDEIITLPTVALFTKVGEVPRMAAKSLNYPRRPEMLASQMIVTPAVETNSLSITTEGTNAETVTNRVNAFADATLTFFKERAAQRTRARIVVLKKRLDSVGAELTAIESKLGPGSEDAVLRARQKALQSQYSQLFGETQDLRRSGVGGVSLELLQPGVAIPQASEGFTTPSNPPVRLAITTLLGFLLGCALALGIERIDSRLRTRADVEEALDLPVLAEIPFRPTKRRDARQIVSVLEPASLAAETYRALRSELLIRTSPDSIGIPPKIGDKRRLGLAVLITSALPGDGKTTTVANLAAALAEAGRSVIILSFDLRNPRIHQLFDLDDTVGVSDLLAQHDRSAGSLGRVMQDTAVPGVQLVTSGRRIDHPGAILTSAGPIIAQAKEMADVVLLDSPPLLAVSDAVDLMSHVDGVLVVTRVNRLTQQQATATRRLLDRPHSNGIGVVLIGSAGQAVPYTMRMRPTTPVSVNNDEAPILVDDSAADAQKEGKL